MKPNLKDFAGLWVALTEQETIGGVGSTASDAVHAARVAWPKERLRIVLFSKHPPHIPLPAWPLKTLRKLTSHATVWVVGGAVRDLLLGREPDDWDFAVADNAVQFARSVADCMQGDFYVLDAERGTGRAIATPPYQTRRVHLDFAEIRGTSIKEDLYTRDFTINAIAMTLNGHVFDPTGGVKDLEENRLSMIRRDALANDPIRLLRAVRLSHQLDLSMDEETAAAVRQLAPEIASVAGERIQAELTKLLKVPEPDRALVTLKHKRLLPHLFPEVSDLASDQWEHTLTLIQALNMLTNFLHDRPKQVDQARANDASGGLSWIREDLHRFIGDLLSQLISYLDEEINRGLSRDHLLRWAALLHESGSPILTVDLTSGHPREEHQASGVASCCKTLRLPNDATDVIKSVVNYQRTPETLVEIAKSRRDIYRYFQQTSEHGLAIAWFSLAHYLAVSDINPSRVCWQRLLKAMRALLSAYFQHYTEVIAPVPLLGGHDLMQLGIEPGPQIGAALSWLVEAQAAGEIHTRNQAIDAISRRYLSPSSQPTTDGDR